MIKDYTEIRELVKSRTTEKRFKHSEGVVQVARYLANKFNLEKTDASIIAIYHDAYRNSTDENTVSFCKENGVFVYPEEEENPMLLHGALAAINFERDVGPVPLYYKTAVRHHTLGSPDMGIYGAVLYISDYTEKGREHLSEEERKEILSKASLEKMVISILEREKIYFEKKGIKEAGVTKELFNSLKAGLVFS